MPARAEAFILEDNARELRELAALTSVLGLVTIETRSPAQALRLLQMHRPTIAIVDWNMELAQEGMRTSEEVLRALAVRHPDAYTIVFATNVGSDLALEERIAGVHPAALTHDKQLGVESLKTRIRRLMGTRIGDLAVDRGSVLHEPTGRRYVHAIGVQIMLSYPREIVTRRRTAANQALWRFKNWLDGVGSTVTVVSAQQGGFHRLALRVDLEAAG